MTCKPPILTKLDMQRLKRLSSNLFCKNGKERGVGEGFTERDGERVSGERWEFGRERVERVERMREMRESVGKNYLYETKVSGMEKSPPYPFSLHIYLKTIRAIMNFNNHKF